MMRRRGADLDRAARLADAATAPESCAMSIRHRGSLRRSFINGTRLWPPAMSLGGRRLKSASFATASSNEVARS